MLNENTQLNDSITDKNKTTLPLDRILPFSLGNSRSKRDKNSFEELKSTISAHGVINPITVRPHPTKSGYFERIAGNGRYEACESLGEFEIPVVIRNLSDNEALEIQLVENSAREDVGLIDEAKAVQKWIAFYNGDKESARARLGWTLKKLNERLELLRCDPKVIEALGIGSIKPAHAMVLASFNPKIQLATLENIIKENWTVQYLRERAGKAQRYLKSAKFNTDNCQSCQHNTQAQAGLFDTDPHAKCSNLNCFKEKTAEYVNSAKQKAEEQFGKVMLWLEISEEDRNTISPDTVGEEQFNNGCTGCESNICFIDDRLATAGTLIKNQCIDKACFKKVTTPEQPKANISTPIEKSSPTEIDNELSQKTENNKKTIQKTNSKIIERSRKTIRNVAGEQFKNNFKYGAVFGTALAIENTKVSIEKFHISSKEPVSKIMAKLFVLSEEELNEVCTEISQIVGLKQEQKDYANTNEKYIDMALECFSTNTNCNEIAINAWSATEESLGLYTIEQLKNIANESGFAHFYNQQNEKTTFEQASNKSKKDLLKTLLSSSFDWSNYAPKVGYLDQIPTPNQA
jgi:PRTRC genetic system ParB family protein